jgi:hypothetical protein
VRAPSRAQLTAGCEIANAIARCGIAARDSGAVRADITGRELLSTVALLCQPVAGEDLSFNEHMVRIFTPA